MLFNSYEFLIFFPIVVLLYFVIPKKWQTFWLLLCSYYFYMNWDPRYIILLIFATLVTYSSGLCILRIREKVKKPQPYQKRLEKWVVFASTILTMSLLFFFKYWDFFLEGVCFLFSLAGIAIPVPKANVLLPVGISFFTFQALSYTIDVYREDVAVEKNILRYAVFVSFFPQLVAGPIERSKNLLRQVQESHSFSYERMREGFLLMLWGFFLKLVIADRAGILVDTVYADPVRFSGAPFLLATFFFSLQIYCDFSSYSIIAMGAAKVLGFTLMENFNCPYFSKNTGEFWRRWHISLSTWFRDYVYIPLGGNRKGKYRKNANLFLTMLISGLWHGASLTFVFWGGLHGLYQVLANVWKPVKARLEKLLIRKPETLSYKLPAMLFTYFLVTFAWTFFRAENFMDVLHGYTSFYQNSGLAGFFSAGFSEMGLSRNQGKVLLAGIGILLFADFFKYRGICVRKILMEQELWCRWFCYLLAIAGILIFGIWGSAYESTDFIYFQF